LIISRKEPSSTAETPRSQRKTFVDAGKETFRRKSLRAASFEQLPERLPEADGQQPEASSAPFLMQIGKVDKINDR
jgi:hypothetical protein